MFKAQCLISRTETVLLGSLLEAENNSWYELRFQRHTGTVRELNLNVFCIHSMRTYILCPIIKKCSLIYCISI